MKKQITVEIDLPEYLDDECLNLYINLFSGLNEKEIKRLKAFFEGMVAAKQLHKKESNSDTVK